MMPTAMNGRDARAGRDPPTAAASNSRWRAFQGREVAGCEVGDDRNGGRALRTDPCPRDAWVSIGKPRRRRHNVLDRSTRCHRGSHLRLLWIRVDALSSRDLWNDHNSPSQPGCLLSPPSVRKEPRTSTGVDWATVAMVNHARWWRKPHSALTGARRDAPRRSRPLQCTQGRRRAPRRSHRSTPRSPTRHARTRPRTTTGPAPRSASPSMTARVA